jgi:hypothetical protein
VRDDVSMSECGGGSDSDIHHEASDAGLVTEKSDRWELIKVCFKER